MKKYKWHWLALVFCFPAFFQQTTFAQEKSDSLKNYKNNIHVNITNPLIFGGKSYVFGYERLINNRQSFSVNAGLTSFPSLGIFNTDSLKMRKVTEESGFNISADYRFYLSKVNKDAPPRGAYIGPYYSYNLFTNKIDWSLTETTGSNKGVNSELRMNIHTVGFEFGYQFVFWNRLSLDMILAGPGVASYYLKTTFGTNLSEADKEKFYEKLNDALAEKFPGYSLVIDDLDFKKSGTSKTTDVGYRYMVQIGFRF